MNNRGLFGYWVRNGRESVCGYVSGGGGVHEHVTVLGLIKCKQNKNFGEDYDYYTIFLYLS